VTEEGQSLSNCLQSRTLKAPVLEAGSVYSQNPWMANPSAIYWGQTRNIGTRTIGGYDACGWMVRYSQLYQIPKRPGNERPAF
jgi:hypothetical protein